MIRTALVAALALLVGAGAAMADTIAMTPEPAGANCAAGGMKITVTHDPVPPATDPTTDTGYVCNGVPGPPGADGTDGADGQDGASGQTGNDGLDGKDGQDGANGFDGTSATNGTSSSGGSGGARVPSCGKASRVVTWRLPARYRRVHTATVIVGGHRRTIEVSHGTVRVDLRGLACGSYPVLVQRRGIRPALRIFTLRRR